MRNIGLSSLILLFIGFSNPLAAQDKASWEVLFNGKDFTNWQSAKGVDAPIDGWEIKNGILSVAPLESGRGKGRDLMTKEKYQNFELEFSFKLTKGANTGVKYLLNKIPNVKGKTSLIGPEYQLIDDVDYPGPPESKKPEGLTGALYLVYPANPGKKFYVNDWNTAKIVKNGNSVEHWLNGKKILDYTWGSDDFISRLNKTKFVEYPDFAKAESGHILLQDHGDMAYFKDIRIKKISSK